MPDGFRKMRQRFQKKRDYIRPSTTFRSGLRAKMAVIDRDLLRGRNRIDVIRLNLHAIQKDRRASWTSAIAAKEGT